MLPTAVAWAFNGTTKNGDKLTAFELGASFCCDVAIGLISLLSLVVGNGLFICQLAIFRPVANEELNENYSFYTHERKTVRKVRQVVR